MAAAYWVEEFSEAERRLLAPHVSNLDRPVFTLRGLPQVTCAALFARYSRSPKSLRRLLVDEFLVGDGADAGPGVPAGAATAESGQNLGPGATGTTVRPPAGEAGRARASDLFGRVLAEYGDDSVAQLAGVHLACEQVSQPLAKAIEWGRLAGYLEQSTRYIPYTDRRDGHYRYRRDPEVMASRHAATYVEAMDGLFDAYCAVIPALRDHLERSLPEESDPGARRRAVRALALDIARGLLPAGTVSNVGVFANPQALEQLVLRLRAHPLPEAREYAELVAAELRAAIPEFVTRLDRPDRGGAWVTYLRETAAGVARTAAQHGLATGQDHVGAGGEGADEPGARRRPGSPASESVTLVRWDADGEDHILAASLFPHADVSQPEVLRAVRALPPEARAEVFRAAVGERLNRRHRPGRGFEHSEYTFEVVVDYGAFRDLQRHRMLTIEWQELTPRLGWSMPLEVEAAGLAGGWAEAVGRAERAWEAVHAELPGPASYLVTLGHRLRCLVRLNAREAMHLVELRTSPQGHPTYRRLCLEMLRQVADVAGHRLVAGSFSFAGREDVHLPRYASEASAQLG